MLHDTAMYRPWPVGGVRLRRSPSRVHVCYAMYTADHARENAAINLDKERALWHGFSSAMPPRIKPRSVRSINNSKPWDLHRGWMRWTFYPAKIGIMRSNRH